MHMTLNWYFTRVLIDTIGFNRCFVISSFNLATLQQFFKKRQNRRYYHFKYFLSLWSWGQAYPSKPFLLIPAWDPRAPAAELFNRQHQRTRKIIEDTYGRWKYTWRFAPVHIAGIFFFWFCFTKGSRAWKKNPVVTYIAVPVILGTHCRPAASIATGGKFLSYGIFVKNVQEK